MDSIPSTRESGRPVAPAASPFDRFKRVGTAMAILVILVAIAEFFWNAANPTDFFHIPPGRVVELGAQVAV